MNFKPKIDLNEIRHDMSMDDNDSVHEEPGNEKEQQELPSKPVIEPEPQKEVQPEIKAEQAPPQKMSVIDWLKAMNWSTNPFIFNISPALFVGYKSQTERILTSLQEGHKYILVVGPTGSGKTTMLRWLQRRLKSDTLYIGKPPSKPEEFLAIFNEKFKKPWYVFWRKPLKSMYQLPGFLNSRLKNQLVVLLDEGHEADAEVLEWLRVINDQAEKMSVVVAGLPNFESDLKNKLETFAKRFSAKIELLSLTKEETRELIRKRITSVGGKGDEFDHLIDQIYNYTGGFPREVIRLCDEIVNSSISKGKMEFSFGAQEKAMETETIAKPATLLDKMTPMQKEILELLSRNPLTPGQIANSLDLAKYKSRQHAVRSVNNVVKKLHEDGFLERRREEKAYVYSLAPKLSTLFVRR